MSERFAEQSAYLRCVSKDSFIGANVTRFGKISPLWPNIKSLWQSVSGFQAFLYQWFQIFGQNWCHLVTLIGAQPGLISTVEIFFIPKCKKIYKAICFVHNLYSRIELPTWDLLSSLFVDIFMTSLAINVFLNHRVFIQAIVGTTEWRWSTFIPTMDF